MNDTLVSKSILRRVLLLLVGVVFGFFLSAIFDKQIDEETVIATSPMGLEQRRRVVQPRGQHVEIESKKGEKISILIMGQSNAANGSFRFHKAKTQEIASYYDGKFFQAADPLPGSNGERGSIWIPVSERLLSKYGQGVHLIPSAIGGTTVTDWHDDGLLERSIFIGKTYCERVGDIDLVVWAQGESDVKLGTHPNAYKMKLASLLKDVNEAFPSAKIIVAISTLRESLVDREIARVQQELISELPFVYGGVNTDQNSGKDRFDGTHFSGEGIENVADMWAQSILDILLERGSR